MQPCNGCKFYVRQTRCKAYGSESIMAVYMRSSNSACGIQRRLYKPTIFRRILNVIQDVDRRNEYV
jgi:hypothetical protein